MEEQPRSLNPKRLYLPLFVLSGWGIIGSAFLLAPKTSFADIVVMLLFIALGISWVYSVNPFDLRKTHQQRQVLLFLALFLVVAFAYFDGHLTRMRMFTVAMIFALGALYSLPIKKKHQTVRLKDLPFLKNVSIGIGWGLLALLALPDGWSAPVIAIAVFTGMQIMVGSAVRDIYDMDLDQKAGIHSIVLTYGLENVRPWFHCFNIFSAVVACVAFPKPAFCIAVLFATAFRGFVIHYASGQRRYLWTQPLNILGTVLFFTILLLERL